MTLHIYKLAHPKWWRPFPNNQIATIRPSDQMSSALLHQYLFKIPTTSFKQIEIKIYNKSVIKKYSCKKCWRLLLICFSSILGEFWLSDTVSPIPIICITKDHLCCLLISKVLANYLLQRVIDRIQMNMYYISTYLQVRWSTFDEIHFSTLLP